jgi:epoxyqueuosine reductase
MPPLEEMIHDFARAAGFALVGIAPATPADGFSRLQEWLSRGYAGEMNYMSRHAAARQHPSSILPAVRSVIMVAMDYSETGDHEWQRKPSEAERANQSKIARYAAGTDYHEVMWHRLDKLLAALQCEVPHCRGRGVVDTAPLLERDFARRAGLGWIGKNTMLINPQRGSYFFLGALLTDLDLKPDAPHEIDHCGSCTACLEACPTQAFAGPGWLDARRCISYLTIELRGPIPESSRPGIGDWLFGCDVCQEVCPWNRDSSLAPQPLDAREVLAMDDHSYRRRFGDTAMTRAKRSGLRRNAALVLGNCGDGTTVEALQAAVLDPDPDVAEAASWALSRIKLRSTEARPKESPVTVKKL